MITCECGLQYPYQDLVEVVCVNGRCPRGYHDRPMFQLIKLTEDEGADPCPCNCHAEPDAQEDT